MGHWSESLVDELAQQVGGSPDRRKLVDLLGEVGRELDALAGRTFEPLRRATSVFEPNGLPFVDVPDLRVGSLETTGVWEVPDPVDAELATVLQVSSLDRLARKAAPVADALWIAGQLVAVASQAGRLSGDYVRQWLGRSLDHEQRQELFRRVMDPAVRFQVPVLGASINGWWFQIARRLIWVTSEAEEDGRLIELLLDDRTTGGEVAPLAATEPVLIVAQMTRQPVDWAFTARIWTEGVQRPNDRPWSGPLAEAIHGHGIPTITVDPNSTPLEIACQVVLKGYWHGYIDGDEPALARAVGIAYPQPVDRIRRQTDAPTSASAAATLLGQLIRPGFDPAQGAEATRRYVRRKASIVVMEHRKQEAPERYPWTRVGISERRYYKLLPQFANKVNGRYDYDHDDVVARMKAHLDERDRDRAVRAAALELLRSRGFKDEAARKWLQRHQPEEAVDAWPRGRRSTALAAGRHAEQPQ